MSKQINPLALEIAAALGLTLGRQPAAKQAPAPKTLRRTELEEPVERRLRADEDPRFTPIAEVSLIARQLCTNCGHETLYVIREMTRFASPALRAVVMLPRKRGSQLGLPFETEYYHESVEHCPHCVETIRKVDDLLGLLQPRIQGDFFK